MLNVELGHKLLLATDRQQLIQDDAGLMKEAEVDQSIAVTDRLPGRSGVGGMAGLSFDQSYARGGSGVVESVCARSRDAQAREEDCGEDGAGAREEVCGPAPATPRGGEPDQQFWNIMA